GAWKVGGVVEDVTAVLTLGALQDDEGVDVAQWAGRIVATPDPREREQRGSDRDALCVLHSGLLRKQVRPLCTSTEPTLNRHGFFWLAFGSLGASTPDPDGVGGTYPRVIYAVCLPHGTAKVPPRRPITKPSRVA